MGLGPGVAWFARPAAMAAHSVYDHSPHSSSSSLSVGTSRQRLRFLINTAAWIWMAEPSEKERRVQM